MNPLDDNGEKRDLYFDTDCIKLINDKWNLEKKAIHIIANNMYFHTVKDLYPLKKAYKRGSSGAKWKQAYQALKHDRYRSLNKGSIKNLIEALGALYILNIYYADDSYYTGRPGTISIKKESSYSSKIFEAYYSYATEIQWNEEVSDKQIIWADEEKPLEQSIFIVKISEDDYRRQHSEWSYIQRKRQILFLNNKTIKRYLKEHPECSSQSIEDICISAGGLRLANEIMGRREFEGTERPLIQIIVNKNREIYPELKKINIHDIDEMIADEFYYQPINDWWKTY